MGLIHLLTFQRLPMAYFSEHEGGAECSLRLYSWSWANIIIGSIPEHFHPSQPNHTYFTWRSAHTPLLAFYPLLLKHTSSCILSSPLLPHLLPSLLLSSPRGGYLAFPRTRSDKQPRRRKPSVPLCACPYPLCVPPMTSSRGSDDVSASGHGSSLTNKREGARCWGI